MERLRTFFRRLCGMSLKRMWNHVVQIHQESGRHQLIILLDMIYCSARYGVGYLDYHVFGFAVNRGERRRTFMTMNHNIALVRALNEREYYPIFNDKIRFNERFDQYLGRAWIDLRKSGPDGFARFIQGQQAVFVKRLDLYGGRGIERIETAGVDPAQVPSGGSYYPAPRARAPVSLMCQHASHHHNFIGRGAPFYLCLFQDGERKERD